MCNTVIVPNYTKQQAGIDVGTFGITVPALLPGGLADGAIGIRREYGRVFGYVALAVCRRDMRELGAAPCLLVDVPERRGDRAGDAVDQGLLRVGRVCGAWRCTWSNR